MRTERTDPPVFARGDVVTIDGSGKEYHVLAVGQAGRDVSVAANLERDAPVWVCVDGVRHAGEAAK